MTEHLTVVARIQAKPEKVAEVRRALTALVEPTHREPGCVSYVLHESSVDPTLFVFYENWRSQEDLDKHLKMPYLQAILARVDELLACPPEIGTYRRIAG